MKKTVLILFVLLNVFMMCMVSLPGEVQAATNVPYVDAAGVEKTAETATEITTSTSELTTGWYVVNADVTREESIIVTGNVYLILADGHTLKVKGDSKRAGIDVSEGNSLTIYGQANATGKLIANSGHETDHTGGAAIGGGFKKNAGNITINGGHIKADSSEMGAGIGGGDYGHCGVVTINAGTVDASCLRTVGTTRGSGAGIGSGNRVGMKDDKNKKGANNGKIIINGGNIRATSNVGAGIGGGFSSDGGEITINGGTIYARSVGDPFWDYGSGAGIGGGCGLRKHLTDYEAIGGDGGNITITGGTITAKSEHMGAGIGGGAIESNNSPDPVIGGSGGNINISGGTINAMGSLYGAGIGGGRKGDGGNVHITGGTVFANSREPNINDIGGGKGYPTTDGTLTISGTSAVFLRNNKSSLPVNTSSHYHKTFSNATEVTDYTVPPNLPDPPGLTDSPTQPEWDSEFAAWLKGELYTISFASAGGSEVATITKLQGTAMTAPANPTREGYRFDGWDPIFPPTMPAENITLTAQWIKDTPATGETDPDPTKPGDSADSNEGNLTELDTSKTDTSKKTEAGLTEETKKLPATGEGNTHFVAGMGIVLAGAGLSILRMRDKTKKEQ